MLANEFNSSKQYVDNLSLNTKRGLRQKVREGYLPSRAPIGYYNDVRTKTAKIDKKIAPIVVQAFELYAKGDQNIYGTGIGAAIAKGTVGGEAGLRGKTQENLAKGEVTAEHLVQGTSSAEYLADVANGEVDDTYIDTDGKEKVKLDASGKKVKKAHGSVGVDTKAQDKFRGAASSALASTTTQARAEGAAMFDQISRV
jgi:hypothetical protein